MGLGISIPVLNERENLERLIPQIESVLAGVGYTLCIVDDGSTDGTREFLEGLMRRDARIHLIKRVKERPGCQRGAASRAALEWLVDHTTHSVLVEMDADGAQPASELMPGALQVCERDYDIAIASKYVPGSLVVGRPRTRAVISKAYSLAGRLLFGRAIRDYSNSYRFYHRSAAELLLRFPARYASPVYLLEILAIWLANDCRVVEVPTHYVERAEGRSKVLVIDIVKGMFGMLDIAWRFRWRQYRAAGLSREWREENCSRS
jgi:dolichol-phosphate mannosyltransferase